MTVFTDFADEDLDECGVFFRDFVTGLGVWRYMNDGGTTVAAAALAFNTTPDVVRRAVEDHPWLFAEWSEGEADPAKQEIGVDGE